MAKCSPKQNNITNCIYAISTNFLKPYIQNQNHANELITNELCKENGYDKICNKNNITEQLCDKDFINCDSMTETKDEMDKCNEELQHIAALNSTVNIPETTDSKTAKLLTYEAKMMKIVLNDTYSELVIYLL